MKKEELKKETNLNDKAKFFALYFGQRVLLWHEHSPIFNLLVEDFKSDTFSNYLLQLTSLSQITDEDALEVLKIFSSYNPKIYYEFETKSNSWNEVFRQVYFDDKSKDGGCHGIDGIEVFANFSNDGLHVLKSNRDSVYWNALDYLRSKGYALPWMGLSVEQLISFGWVKLKEANQ